ncbi:MAG: DUF4160 domain-containing protein [Betaproteobacteria bacterium]|nr:DUF4160 domain-containing protein [Betaproteobacteria bacterium]
MDFLSRDNLQPALDLRRRQRQAFNDGGDHRFGPAAERLRFELPDGIGRLRDDDVRAALRGGHAAPELREGVRDDHRRRNAAAFESGRDVATPRRTRPSVAGGGDRHVHAAGEAVERLAHRIEQLSGADRQLAHRLLHDERLEPEAFLEQLPDFPQDVGGGGTPVGKQPHHLAVERGRSRGECAYAARFVQINGERREHGETQGRARHGILLSVDVACEFASVCPVSSTARVLRLPERAFTIARSLTFRTRKENAYPPHFHVRYEDFRAIVGIDPLELREGQLPPRVLGLVMEWAELHQAELRENWTTLAAEGKFKRIAPLV